MKKNKGFTLIELLAVIVILAIIALIAVPVILNVIEKSKIGAAEQSAQGYIDAVEKQIVTNKVKNENLFEEGEYTKSQLDEKNVKIKGEITDALVVIGEKGRVTQGRFCINGYSIDYDGKKATKNTEVNYCNEIGSILNTCPYEVNQVFNFDYTGDIQKFTPECSGKYKLEVWGAQGGVGYSNSSYEYSGKGGYSYGEITLESSATVYVVVGQRPSTYTGGYNGGGNGNGYGQSCTTGGGGGATHIATRTGLLSSLQSYNDDILIVAGGGGAGTSSIDARGGAGGGNNGETPPNSNGTYNTTGGTQSTGGSGYGSGSFGQGGLGYGCDGGGGGAGYYGGGGGYGDGGAGGSGYLNASLLSNDTTLAGNQTFKAPGGNNETGHTGNGYARITYLGK